MQKSPTKISRRGFGRLAAAAPLAASVVAASPQQTRRAEQPAVAVPPQAPPDVIETFDVPVPTEPCFVFRP